MKWNSIYCLGIGLLVMGCVKDDGNYSYRNVNQISVKNLSFDYDHPKVVYVGDSLKLVPELIFGQEPDTSGLFYHWVMNDDTVATTRNLNMVVMLTPVKRVYCSYRIFDSKTGVEYITPFYLKVGTSFVNGWLFLCEKTNGHGQLNFFRQAIPDESIPELLCVDGYLNANGEELSEKPISIRHHFLPMHSMYMPDNQISIVCQGAPDFSVEVDGSNFKKVVRNIDEFVSNTPPVDFFPQATFNASAGYAIMSNGKLYSRSRDYGDPFQEGYFTNFPIRPVAPLEKDYHLAPFMLPFNFNEPYEALLFDEKHQSYCRTDGLGIYPLQVDNDVIKAFDPMNMGKRLLSVGRIRREEWDFMSGGEFFAILKDQEGQYWEQRFSVTPAGFGGDFQSLEEKKFDGGAYFSDNSIMVTPTMTSYIYFTSGDGRKLYSYNFETSVTKEIPLPFSSPITAMAVENGDEELIVGVNNNGIGDIYWLSVKLGEEGTVRRTILGKMGKPLDIKYKPESWFF